MTRSIVSLFSHDSCAMIWEANRSIDGFCMGFGVAEEHMVRASNCRTIGSWGKSVKTWDGDLAFAANCLMLIVLNFFFFFSSLLIPSLM